jgi:hypothetical protein
MEPSLSINGHKQVNSRAKIYPTNRHRIPVCLKKARTDSERESIADYGTLVLAMLRCRAAGVSFIKPAANTDDLLMADGPFPPEEAFSGLWLSESLIVVLAGLTIEWPFYMF